MSRDQGILLPVIVLRFLSNRPLLPSPEHGNVIVRSVMPAGDYWITVTGNKLMSSRTEGVAVIALYKSHTTSIAVVARSCYQMIECRLGHGPDLRSAITEHISEGALNLNYSHGSRDMAILVNQHNKTIVSILIICHHLASTIMNTLSIFDCEIATKF